MGIKRLTQFLRDEFHSTTIAALAGETVGVDTSSWIYQWFFCQYDSLVDPAILIIRNLEMRLKLFEANNVKVTSSGHIRFRRPQTPLQAPHRRETAAEAGLLPGQERRRWANQGRNTVPKKPLFMRVFRSL